MGISYRTRALHLYFLLYISSDFPLFSQAANTLTQGQILRDGKTIVSSGEDFELGFFSPANSTLRFVGIWYKTVSTQTVIWVANRESPLVDKNGALKIGNNGNLMVLDGNGTSIWSSNYTSVVFANSTAILMDTGNLIISSSSDSVGDPDNTLWQSFEDPTDNFLPGMKVHANLYTDENPVLFTSWTSLANPSRGNYSMGIDPRGSPQIVIWEEGSKRWWRSGHWNGLIFLGIPKMRSFYFNGFKFNSDGDDDIYITYTAPISDQIVRFQIRWDGYVEQLIWNERTKNWGALQSHPANQCELYNKCGSFGMCSEIGSSPTCSCIEGFEPKNSDQWNKGNWSSGCIRKKPLNCGSNGSSDGFITVKGVKLPDYADVVVSDNIEECEEKCLRNCSCNAYAFEVGIQCMMWSVDLVDIEHFTEGGRILFVRLANSELGGKSRISIALIVTTIVGGTIVLGLLIWLIIWRFGAKLKAEDSGSLLSHNELSTTDVSNGREFSAEFSVTRDLSIEREQGNRPELPLFSFNCVADATNNFAGNNKLGEGGFGSVYKGILPGGQEIAIKRLARCSGQGLEEFKNEMILIAKLQHRSLVRLLGCCIEREEKLLIYEYMPNKSLDSFLFEPDKQAQLDWSKRFTIIKGIAQGLLYLHRDSRLKIVHRDLKASNILLDEEMNPKISDFGIARIFGGSQSEANTIRVVGTYGYMSPEYAMEGLFSTKSDVYSFGILLLEIVSGQRSIGFRISEFSNLIRYAWHLWNEGKAMELIDPCIAKSCCRNEVLRCIHVGMLCVQHSVADRPIMSSVVLMLESEWATLPMPRQPTFSSVHSNIDSVNMDLGTEGDYTTSTNDVTVTDVLGR